jgi:hypothetical protein
MFFSPDIAQVLLEDHVRRLASPMDRKFDLAENTVLCGQFLVRLIMKRPDADSSRFIPVGSDRYRILA